MGLDPLIVAVLGALLGFVLGVVLSYGTFLGRRYNEARGKHKLLLIATLKRELPQDHPVAYDGDRFYLPGIEWGKRDSPSIKVLVHLLDPSYVQISTALSAAQDRYSMHTAEMEIERAKFELQIDKVIGEPLGMVRWTGMYPGPKPWYDRSSIRKILFEDHRKRLGGGYFDPLDLDYERLVTSSGGQGFQLILNRTQVAVGSEGQMASLEAKIRPLLHDSLLREGVRRMDLSDSSRVGEPTRQAFDNERNALLERLVLKSEALRGKCSLCPGFFRILPVEESSPGTL